MNTSPLPGRSGEAIVGHAGDGDHRRELKSVDGPHGIRPKGEWRAPVMCGLPGTQQTHGQRCLPLTKAR